MNVHLSSSEKDTQPGSNRKSVDGSAAGKYLKRNGKKLRYRRQPWSGKVDEAQREGAELKLGEPLELPMNLFSATIFLESFW